MQKDFEEYIGLQQAVSTQKIRHPFRIHFNSNLISFYFIVVDTKALRLLFEYEYQP